MNEWTIREFGSEHNASAEQLAAEEQRAARFRALDAAGPCELCGWSGTVPAWTGAGFRLEEKCPCRCGTAAGA